MRVVERVVDVPPLLAIADKPARTKQSQVVRAGRLAESGDRGEITDTQLTCLEKRRNQPDSSRVGEHLEGLRHILKDLRRRKARKDRGNPFRLDTRDFTAVERRDRGRTG